MYALSSQKNEELAAALAPFGLEDITDQRIGGWWFLFRTNPRITFSVGCDWGTAYFHICVDGALSAVREVDVADGHQLTGAEIVEIVQVAIGNLGALSA